MNQVNKSVEEQLRDEISALRRQLEEQKQQAGGGASWRPLVLVVLLLGGLALAGYFLGYAPRAPGAGSRGGNPCGERGTAGR
jgi:hypothetical protein